MATEMTTRRKSAESPLSIRQVGRMIGGFDNDPCFWCQREEPCRCGSTVACACSCGRCLYPFPLPDDGPPPVNGETNGE